MSKLKNKFSFVFLIFSFFVSSFSYAVEDLEEAKDCLTATEISNKYGNFVKGDDSIDMYESCGGHLQAIDFRFLSVATAIIDKETFAEMKSTVAHLGGDFDRMVDYFDDNVPLQNYVEILMPISMVLIGFALTMYAVFSKNQSALMGVAIAILFAILAYAGTKVPEYAVRGWMYATAQYNHLLYSKHNVDRNIEFFENNNLLAPSITLIEDQHKQLSGFLHLTEAINVATGNSITSSTYGSKLEVDFDFRHSGGNDIDEPSVAEYFEQQNACLAKDRVEADSNFELNFETWSDEGIGSYIVTGTHLLDIPSEANFVNGGETHDYNCSDSSFGYEQSFAKVQNNALNIAQNFIEGKTAKHMNAETSLFEDFKSTQSQDLNFMENEFQKVDLVFGSIQQNITGKLALSYAAAKEAQATHTDFKNTETYKTLVEDFKKISMPVFKYEGQQNFSTTELAELNALKLFTASFSLLFTEGNEDPNLRHSVNGWHFIQPFVEKTIRMQMAIDCALQDRTNGNGTSMYSFKEEYAYRWNAMDKNIKNSAMSSIGGHFDSACFIIEDGVMDATYADPALVDIHTQEISARAQAVEILLSAMSNGILTATMSNNNELWEDAKIEYLNKIRPNLQSINESNLGFLKMKSQLESVYASTEDIYTFETSVPLKQLTLPQHFYNFNRFSNDVVTTEDMDRISHSLEPYKLDTVFTADVNKSIEQTTSNGFSWKELGASKLFKEALATGECPIQDRNGICKSNVQELNYQSSNKLIKIEMPAIAMQTVIKAARFGGDAIGDVANTADQTVIGDVKGPHTLLIWFGKGVHALAVAIDSTLGWIFDLLVVIIGIMIFAGKLAQHLPLITELVLTVYQHIYLIVPILLLPIVPVIEVIQGSIRTISGVQNNAFNFDGTIMLLKVGILRWIIFYVALNVFIFINYNPAVGSAVYHLVSSNFKDTGYIAFFIQNMLLSISYIWVLFKSIPIINDLEAYILRLLKVDTTPTFNETNSFMNTLISFGGGRLFGHISRTNKLSNVAVEKGSQKIGSSIHKGVNTYKNRGSDTENLGKALDTEH
ncbi:hypothetical protein AB6C47_018130 [Vibrio cyclitrophicus]